MLTVEEAGQALQEAICLSDDIAGELEAVDLALSKAQTEAGPATLAARKKKDQKQIEKINSNMLKLASQADILRSTLKAARNEIKDARKQVNLSQAHVLREQAQEILISIEARQAKTTDLLEQLFRHEGIRYVPEPETVAGCVIQNSYALGTTTKMMIDADALIRQANSIESRKTTIDGPVSTSGRKTPSVWTG